MDTVNLKIKIEQTTLLSEELKTRLLADFDKLTEDHKKRLEDALNVTPIYEEAYKKIKKEEKAAIKEIKNEVEGKEDEKAEKDLIQSLTAL